MLRIGVIGVGIMGSGHVRTIHRTVPGAVVAAVSDPDQARASALAGEVGASVLDAAALIEAVDAVVIAAPDVAHAALTIACIGAGKPVLVEKPLATSALEALSIVEAEREGGRSLVSVGFMRRFDPSHTAIRDRFGAEGIGDPVLLRSIHRNQWRPAAPTARSTVVASGIHDIDSARWLLGEFVSVSALARDTRGDGAVDVVHIHGHHARGGISALEVNCAAGYGYEVSAEVVGTNGVASSLDPDPVVVRLANRRGTDIPTNWMPRFADAYRIQMRAWVDTCVDGVPYPGATALDGYRDQVVAEAVLDALTGGTIVNLQ